MKAFVFDASKCNGCHGCQIACKDEHCGNEWLPYAKSQPDTGQFWCKIDEKVHGQVPRVRFEYRIQMCRHCDECKVLAIAGDAAYKREDGLVIIDPEKPQGRSDLVDACPYGAVFYNEELAIPQKCTGCAHLVDAGEKPRCVDFCQTGALRFGDVEEFAGEIEGAETFDAGTGSRVYYLNLPKLFAAGNVWDPDEDEVVENATVILSDAEGNTLETQQTDDFGDFEFKKLDEGDYRILIEADGFATQSRSFALDESKWLGDFQLAR